MNPPIPESADHVLVRVGGPGEPLDAAVFAPVVGAPLQGSHAHYYSVYLIRWIIVLLFFLHCSASGRVSTAIHSPATECRKLPPAGAGQQTLCLWWRGCSWQEIHGLCSPTGAGHGTQNMEGIHRDNNEHSQLRLRKEVLFYS